MRREELELDLDGSFLTAVPIVLNDGVLVLDCVFNDGVEVIVIVPLGKPFDELVLSVL